MSDRNSNLLAGALSALVGVIAAVGIYARPEGLNVPAWVAYAAVFAFVLAGLVIVAIETRRARAHAWLMVALLAAMFTPAAWVAFGPGDRACNVIGGILETAATGIVCRGAFGVGALILAFMIVVAFRAARNSNNAN